MAERAPRILFAGGGTGGHVYPAIAIADAIRARDSLAAIAFAGTKDRMEWEAVPKAGYPIHPIRVQGLQRRLTTRNLQFPVELVKGLYQSWRLVKEFDADVVVGTGGYVAGPVLLAAYLRGRPCVVQEQNAYPGLTSRLVGRWAESIYLAYPEAAEYFASQRCVVAGNPVRQSLEESNRNEARTYFDLTEEGLVVLVLGGSLGSGAINDALAARVDSLLGEEAVHIIWQVGSRYREQIPPRLQEHPRIVIKDYIDEMRHAYAAADVAVCRAGALTCSELMLTGTPAVLVPSPNVAEDHQTKNAQSLVERGGAVLVPESVLQEQLVGAVRKLLDDETRRHRMAKALQEMAHPEAADHIAGDVLTIARDQVFARSQTADDFQDPRNKHTLRRTSVR